MSTAVKPTESIPANLGLPIIFLAGTIDNGDSLDWQAEVLDRLSDEEVVILNPRRDDWDDTWSPEIGNKVFKEQVEWELEGLINSDIIFMYFAPGSVSPVSLLELGTFIDSNIIVVVPDGYFRKGNIEITVEFMTRETIYHTLEDGLAELKNRLEELR